MHSHLVRYIAGTVALIFVLTGLSLHSTLPVWGQASLLAMNPVQRSQLESRLNLSESQKPQVREIIQRSMQEREVILSKRGITLGSAEKPSLFQLIGLANDMKSVDEWTYAALSKVLSPVQMREYERISAEQREAVRRQLLD